VICVFFNMIFIRVGKEVIKAKGMALLVGFYPKVAQLIPNLSGWNYLTGLKKVREDLYDGIIEDHLKNRSLEHPRDYIDVYLSEVDKTEDPNSSFHRAIACMLCIYEFMATFETRKY